MLCFFGHSLSSLSSNFLDYTLDSLSSGSLSVFKSLELLGENLVELLLESLSVSLFDSSNTEFSQNSGGVLCVQSGFFNNLNFGSFFNNLSGFLRVTARCERHSCSSYEHKHYFFHFFAFLISKTIFVC